MDNILKTYIGKSDAEIQKLRKKNREDYHQNKEKRRQKHLEWLKIPGNYEKSLKKAREYKKNNLGDIQKQRNEKRRVNSITKIQSVCRTRIRQAIEYYKNKLKIPLKKENKTLELIGCSFESLVKRIEGLWKEGMTWDNHGYGKGKWVVDHIKPCCSFDLRLKDEQLKCFSYMNMQPLWWEDNQKKIKEDKKQKFNYENSN